jgi:competence protein ComEC
MAANDQRGRFTLDPLLWLAISFAIGIVTAYLWELPLGFLIGVAMGFAVAGVLRREYPAASFLMFAAFIAIGAGCYIVELSSVSADRVSRMYDDGRLTSGDPLEIEGTVVGMPEAAPDGYFITLTAEKIFAQHSDQHVSGRLRLFAPVQTIEAEADYSALDLRHGTRLRVACDPEREERYLNPGVTPRKKLLDRQGIDVTATLKSPLLIEKLGRDSVFLPLAFVYERRANLIDHIRDQFDQSTAGVLIASMLGDKYFLDRQTAEVFREGGTFHVLVISGLHITFIGGLILLLVRRLTHRRMTQAVVAVSSLWLYGIAVGGEAPVIRACVMFTVMMFGYAFYRTSTLMNALGGSALVLLVWRPSDLFDPSFQLTFVSIAAIVALGLPVIEKLESIGGWTPTAARPFPPNVPNWLRRLSETIYWRDAAWEIERGRQGRYGLRKCSKPRS